MGNVWYTDIQHFLDADGYPAPGLPRPAERLMEHFGSIIEAVTGRNEKKATKITDVQCRRRPGHWRCEGRILAAIAEVNPEAVEWECPLCSDRGLITGWRGSIWDKMPEKKGPVE
jgi:hypothetical protein